MTDEPMRLYQMTARVWATQVPCAFTVQSLDGPLTGQAGDWLVMDEERSHAWVVAKARPGVRTVESFTWFEVEDPGLLRKFADLRAAHGGA